MKNKKNDNSIVKMKLRIPEKIMLRNLAVSLALEMNTEVKIMYGALKEYARKETIKYSEKHPTKDRFTLTIHSEEFKLVEPVSLVILIKRKKG